MKKRAVPFMDDEDEPQCDQDTLIPTGSNKKRAPCHPPLIPSPDDERIGTIYVEDVEEEKKDDNDCSTSTSAMATTTTSATTSTSTQHNINYNRTGLVIEAGVEHFDYRSRLHKERPSRIHGIQEALQKSDNPLWSRCCILEEDNSTDNNATKFLQDEDFLRVHLPGYMKRLESIFDCNCQQPPHQDRLDQEAEQFSSIYFAPESLQEAKKAAASLCRLVERVLVKPPQQSSQQQSLSQQLPLDNGFALIRPPGHHAEPFQAGGYCIINNVAVAAAYARHHLGARKILIVDWDVHHGNGTQRIFQNDPNVLYFSVHRWHGGNFYPHNSEGGPTFVGTREGAGTTVNVGWTQKGMGDDEYYAVWESLLLPLAKEFQPDLLLVSAGFDAALGDVGECEVTPDCFGQLTRQLLQLNIPLVCALEGGYVRSVLGECVCQVVTALLEHGHDQGDSSQPDEEEELAECDDNDSTDDIPLLDCIAPTAAKNIKATMAAHQSYWKCFN